MFTQHNGLYVDTMTLDAIRSEQSELDVLKARLAELESANRIPRTHRMFQLVQAGLSNKAAVLKIREEYGDVPTNTSSIAWVRQAIRDASAGKATKQAAYANKTMAKLTATIQ